MDFVLSLVHIASDMFRQKSALSSTIVLVILVIIVSVALLPVVADAEMSGVMGGPPERPDVFRNPDELKEYLKALNDYFAIVGRPR